ncbi:MAG: hypothetical protein EBT54_04110 [Betaproteobacteria bacterium]|nr:hypothetical protein [Betaproteobacteria bacterium]
MSASFDDSLLALDQQLIQLVYRSRSLIEGPEYDALLATCLRNNPGRGITGVLVNHSGWFLQVLEGTAASPAALRIPAAAAHGNPVPGLQRLVYGVHYRRQATLPRTRQSRAARRR